MEIVLCREKKGNWKLPGGSSSRLFPSTPVAAKVAFAGPNPLSRNENREPQRVPGYFTPCAEQAFPEPFWRQNCSQPFAFYCHSLFHLSNPALDLFPSPLWPIWCLCRAVLWPCLNFSSFVGYLGPFLPFSIPGSQL